MAIRPLNQNVTSAPKKEQERRDERREERYDDRRDDRYDRRDEDREDMRSHVTTLREATRNKFGDRNNPTRALTALGKYAKDYLGSKAKLKDVDYDIVVVEKNVEVPAIVLVSRNEVKGGDETTTMVCGHAILLVDYSRRPDSLSEYRDGSTTYYETTVWADAYDSYYIEEIQAQITAQLDLENFQYVDGGCSAVNFPDLPIDKLTGDSSFTSAQIDNMLFTVLTSVEALRMLENGEEDYMLRPELLPKDSEIVADINLTANSSVTPTGLPVAEDFMIRVREVKGYDRRDRRDRNQMRSMNRKDESGDETYGGVSGRIDFIQVEAEALHVSNPRIEDAAVHVPEFIISGFDVYDRMPSLSMLFQMISAVGILGDRTPPIFLSAFRPENIVDTPSRNLGALAMELNDIKTRKPVPRQNFRTNTTDADLRDFARGAIIPDCRIGIEIPTQGPLTTLLSLIYYASIYAKHNDRDYLYANELCVKACDILTGGRFSEKWDPSEPIMTSEIATIPGGYWIDDNGEKRDSRELGYLFYANLDNPTEALEMSREYADSFEEEEEIIATNTRKRLITEVKGNNFVQTDNFRRCYFAADFIDVLNDCLRSSGLGVMSPNTNFGGRGNERRRRDSVAGLMSRRNLEYSRFSSRRDDGRSGRHSYQRRNGGYRRN